MLTFTQQLIRPNRMMPYKQASLLMTFMASLSTGL